MVFFLSLSASSVTQAITSVDQANASAQPVFSPSQAQEDALAVGSGQNYTGMTDAIGFTVPHIAHDNSQGTYNTLYGKWFNFYENEDVGLRNLLIYVAPIAVVFSGVIVFFCYRRRIERKTAQNALQQSESHLRLSQVSGGIGTWEADLVNNIQTWSENCLVLLGVPSLTEPTWEGFLAVVHPEDRQRVSDATQAHIDHNIKYDVEYRTIAANGEFRWMRSAGQVERDANGKPILMRGIVQNITDRKNTEAELAQAREDLEARENAFRTLIENTPDTIARYDRACRRIYANPALIDSIAKPADEIVGKTPVESSPPSESMVLYQEKVEEVFQKGRIGTFLLEWQNANGDAVYTDIRLIPERDQDGNIVSVLGIGQDVTERKLAEEQMKKSISLLHATLESSNDAILVVDLNNKWVLHNRRFDDLWHITDEISAFKDDAAALLYVMNQLEEPDAFLNRVHELYATSENSSFDILKFKNGKIIERYSIPQCIDGAVVGRVWSFRDVTERKSAEQALIRESEKNHALLRNASDGIHIIDFDGNLIEVSDSFCAMLGYRRDEMIGMNVSQWDATFTGSELLQVVRRQFENPVRSQFETCHRRKDGSLFDVEISGFPLELDGRPVLFNSSRDITERKQAEKRLSESENKYRLLIESAKDAIFLADAASGTLIDCNKSAENLLGKSKTEIIGLHQSELHPADKAELYKKLFKQHIESDKDIIEDVFVVHKDGHAIEVDINASVFELNGRTTVLGIFRNITERKRAESEMRIAATAFESQEGMLITDTDSVILRVNRAFTEITGYTAEEAIGKTPHILSSGRHNADFYAEMWDSINNTGAWGGEIWNRRKDGEIYPETLTITAVKDPNGMVTNYVATMSDITLRKAAEANIEYLAFYDPLTGLPNRRLLLDRLQHTLASCARSGQEGALLFLDLDHFKTLNDSLGHDIGDMLLQQVGERLVACVREGDTVARLGGDEFVVVLEDLGKLVDEAAAQTETIGEKILAALNRPYQLGVHRYSNSSSIGIALFNGRQQSREILLKHADIAMYQAKKAGRNTLRFFDPQMQANIIARVSLENELRKALDARQFQLYYQIQVDSSGHPLGAEALVRWLHPVRGLVSPTKFIPLAEETGLILAIGQWVLDAACAQLNAWQQNVSTRDLMLSVNVSAKQYHQTEFVDQVLAAIQRHSINPKQLKLELTESMLLENIEDTIAMMNVLGETGVQFSLDDFGTGYSSLQYLKRLPLYQLKIDQSFVRDIANDSSDKAIVRTIIAMAQSLNLNVIAEGVETEEQRQLLLSHGCTHYQGYLFGKPIPIEAFEASLQ